MAVRIDRSEFWRDPQELADEILALCRLSAMRAQVMQRQELAEYGFSASVIAALGLPTDDDLASAERARLTRTGESAFIEDET